MTEGEKAKMKFNKLWILSALVSLTTAGFLGLGCGCSDDDDDDVCGDGKVNQAEGVELCDGPEQVDCDDGCYDGAKVCLSEQETPDCTGYTTCNIGDQECGNDIPEGCEECESSDAQSCDDGCYDGEKACKADCS